MMRLLFLLFTTIPAAVCVKTTDSNSALRGNVASRFGSAESVALPIPESEVDIDELWNGKNPERKDREVRRLVPEDFMELSLWTYMETVEAADPDLNVYTRFLALMQAAGKDDALTTFTGITLFAPGDDAITGNMKDFLLAEENDHILREVMNYHILPRVLSYLGSEFKNNVDGVSSSTTFTVAGDNLEFELDQNGFYINRRTNVLAYALANESLLYRIDRLLIPPSMNAFIPEELLLENSQQIHTIPADLAFEFPIAIPDGFFTSNAIIDLVSLFDTPSIVPSDAPSFSLSDTPSITPSDAPSITPSDSPSIAPSALLSFASSDVPSQSVPLDVVSAVPSDISSDAPSSISSELSSDLSSDVPSFISSELSSDLSSDVPTSLPISAP